MPEIRRFFGVVVRMFYAEHGVAHFRADDGGDSTTIAWPGDVDPDGLYATVSGLPIEEVWKLG